MLIQYLLLLAFAAVTVALLRRSSSARSSMRSVATRRLLLLAVSFAGIAAVLQPSLTTTAANAVGVGRGADLVLYLLAAASVFAWSSTHLRMRANDAQTVLLARRLAITEALLLNAARHGSAASRDVPTAVTVPAPRAAETEAPAGLSR